MRLALTCGYRVFVCSQYGLQRRFYAGPREALEVAKSRSILSQSASIVCSATSVPCRSRWSRGEAMELSNVAAKMIVYEAFIESELEVPKHLARRVHDLYFEPQYEEFRPRTLWSLSNAFTSAFKELDPIPQFKATAKLGGFLEERLARKF